MDLEGLLKAVTDAPGGVLGAMAAAALAAPAYFAKGYIKKRAEIRAEGDAGKQVPFSPQDSKLYGRADELQISQEILSRPDDLACPLVLSGIGGIGKTKLAVAAGYAAAETLGLPILFVDMQGESGVQPHAQAQAFMSKVILDLEPTTRLGNGHELNHQFQTALMRNPVVLILDNADDPDVVEKLVPPENSRLIVTSRRNIFIRRCHQLKLDNIPESDAVELLRSFISELRSTDEELCTLAELCDFHPLALTVAGSFVANYPDLKISAFINTFRNKGIVALDPVRAALSVSVEALRLRDQTLLDIWLQMALIPSHFDHVIISALTIPTPTEEQISLLVSLGLLEFSEHGSINAYFVHDMLRACAMTHMSETQIAETRLRICEAFLAVLAQSERFFRGGHIEAGLALFSWHLANIQTCLWTACKRIEDQRYAQLCLDFIEVGTMVIDFALPADFKLAVFEAGRDAAKQMNDIHHEAYLLGNIGRMHTALGNPQKGIACTKEAMLLLEQVNDIDALTNSYTSLGVAYMAQGMHDEAYEHFRKALDVVDANPESAHCRRMEAAVCGNVGAYAREWDPEFARKLFERQMNAAEREKDYRAAHLAKWNIACLDARTDTEKARALGLEAFKALALIGDPMAARMMPTLVDWGASGDDLSPDHEPGQPSAAKETVA